MPMKKLWLFLLISLSNTQCRSQQTTPPLPQQKVSEKSGQVSSENRLIVGAAQLDKLVEMVKNKRVGLVVNYTAMVGKTHLADTLKSLSVDVRKILAPEHGFRGTAAAGEYVKDGSDIKTGLPVVSLYGKDRKPTAEHLKDIDIIVFDIQDVGVRFFTYIGTLHYVMEACAENDKEIIVLDRPNPNASYIDGPVLKMEFKSFIGMHPVPVVHGLTIGEFAQLINGEKWLEGNRACKLQVIPLKNWTHNDPYSLPVKPSPNLPNDQAIKLYPSICFFEGTVLSLGRGTQMPFQVIGHPDLKNFPFQFTPVSIEGMAKNPPQENQLCYGLDLRSVAVPNKIELHYLLKMYKSFPDKEKFFIPFFERLAGNSELRQQIKDGLTEEQIRATWQKDLDEYKLKRAKYLLYP
jgi:uncharacterized protein YbbC (DUF1343 family)